MKNLRKSISSVMDSPVSFCSSLSIGHEDEDLSFKVPLEMNFDKITVGVAQKLTRMLASDSNTIGRRVHVPDFYLETYLPSKDVVVEKTTYSTSSANNKKVSKFSTMKDAVAYGSLGLRAARPSGDVISKIELPNKDLLDGRVLPSSHQLVSLFKKSVTNSPMLAIQWRWEDPTPGEAGHAMLLVVKEDSAHLIDPDGGEDKEWKAIFRVKINEYIVKQARMLFISLGEGEGSRKFNIPHFPDFNAYDSYYQSLRDSGALYKEDPTLKYVGDKEGLCFFTTLYFLLVYICTNENVFSDAFWNRRYIEICGEDPFPPRRQYHVLMYFRSFTYSLLQEAKMRKLLDATTFNSIVKSRKEFVYTRHRNEVLTSVDERRVYDSFKRQKLNEKKEKEDLQKLSSDKRRGKKSKEPARRSSRFSKLKRGGERRETRSRRRQ